jgi:hypothetical protein
VVEVLLHLLHVHHHLKQKNKTKKKTSFFILFYQLLN